jgi:hypothetical protein
MVLRFMGNAFINLLILFSIIFYISAVNDASSRTEGPGDTSDA